MRIKTYLGLPDKYIAKKSFSKGDCFVLDSVHLKEELIPATEKEPETLIRSMDIWYITTYKPEKAAFPLGIVCSDVAENGEAKNLIIFRDVVFTPIQD